MKKNVIYVDFIKKHRITYANYIILKIFNMLSIRLISKKFQRQTRVQNGSKNKYIMSSNVR